MTVDILKKRHIKEMQFDLPDCDEWAERNLRHWQGTRRDMLHIRKLIHQHVCADVNHTFRQLKKDIDEAW